MNRENGRISTGEREKRQVGRNSKPRGPQSHFLQQKPAMVAAPVPQVCRARWEINKQSTSYHLFRWNRFPREERHHKLLFPTTVDIPFLSFNDLNDVTFNHGTMRSWWTIMHCARWTHFLINDISQVLHPPLFAHPAALLITTFFGFLQHFRPLRQTTEDPQKQNLERRFTACN